MITVEGARTFGDILPGIGQNQSDAYFRHDWCPARVALRSSVRSPSWTARDAASAPVPVVTDTRDAQAASIAKPANASWIEVEDGQALTRIWFVSATLTVRATGVVSATNPNWATVQTQLRNERGAPEHHFKQLGPVEFNAPRATPLPGRRYGLMVEIVGRVSPHDIAQSGMKFYIARRIVSTYVHAFDDNSRPLPSTRDPQMRVRPYGTDDTSLPQSGQLSRLAEVFDYDVCGSMMTEVNRVGDVHSIDLRFEQCVVIGEPPAARGGAHWQRIAQGSAVSPIIPSRCGCTVRVQRAGRFPSIALLGHCHSA
jgi:hypothetical protein